MKKRQLRFPNPGPPPAPKNDLSRTELTEGADEWFYALEARQCSPRTLEVRRLMVRNMLWLFDRRGFERIGTLQLRALFSHVKSGHTEPGGRWGHPQGNKPNSERTVKDYYTHLRSLFRWLVKDGRLSASPLEKIEVPISRDDQIQPFSEQQVTALIAAAGRSRHPARDVAVVKFLLDTGIRAEELCGLRQKDIDLHGGRCVVLGKGNKKRQVYFRSETKKALVAYLRGEEQDAEAPLFLSDRGTDAGGGLTRSGLYRLIRRAGKVARIELTRCSPHTLRHTAAVFYLRAGGPLLTLKEMLGHESIKSTSRYVALAQADIEANHRQFSPVEYLKRRRPNTPEKDSM